VAYIPETPFENIESAQEFVELLEQAIEEARRDVEGEITATAENGDERRIQALQLVSYNLAKLSLHIGTSHRILNDLRSLRRLLLQERKLRVKTAESEA
jgi:phospholipid N-methyltransferase